MTYGYLDYRPMRNWLIVCALLLLITLGAVLNYEPEPEINEPAADGSVVLSVTPESGYVRKKYIPNRTDTAIVSAILVAVAAVNDEDERARKGRSDAYNHLHDVLLVGLEAGIYARMSGCDELLDLDQGTTENINTTAILNYWSGRDAEKPCVVHEILREKVFYTRPTDEQN